jgi:hypothetical protein
MLALVDFIVNVPHLPDKVSLYDEFVRFHCIIIDVIYSIIMLLITGMFVTMAANRVSNTV